MGKLKIDTTDNFSFSSHDGTAPTPTERKRSESNASNGGGVGMRRNSSMRTISDSDPRMFFLHLLHASPSAYLIDWYDMIIDGV